MIDLAPHHLEMVRDVFRRHGSDFKVFAFGSRVDGSARKFSDLDLALVPVSGRSVSAELIWSLRDAFSESDLPIGVDLVSFPESSVEFQGIIRRSWVQIFPVDEDGVSG